MLLYLHISAAGHFSEVLLLLQGLVHLVIRHAETAQASLDGVQCLCKYDKLGHIRNADDLSVQLAGKVHGLLSLSAVYQPEPRKIHRNLWSSIDRYGGADNTEENKGEIVAEC